MSVYPRFYTMLAAKYDGKEISNGIWSDIIENYNNKISLDIVYDPFPRKSNYLYIGIILSEIDEYSNYHESSSVSNIENDIIKIKLLIKNTFPYLPEKEIKLCVFLQWE